MDAALGKANGQGSGSTLSGQQDMDAEVEGSKSSKAEGASTCGCLRFFARGDVASASHLNYKNNNEVMIY